MKRTPLTAMLTPVAVLASTFAVAGCGGKGGSSSTKSTTTKTTTKHKSNPNY
jgi:ABC-type glycerol-3-phosphate transport system substrate-binding protein